MPRYWATPHQICQFHAIKEAGRLIYVLDHRIKTDMRIRMQQKTHEYRQDLHRRLPLAQAEEAAYLGVLEEYAATVEGALNLDSTAPFDYGGLAMQDALSQIHSSLQTLGKKGAVSQTCQKRLKRLTTIVSLYEEQREELSQVRAMREWVMRLEHILDGSWAESPAEIGNAEVAWRFDEWLKDLTSFLQAEGRTQEEQLRLGHLLKVMSHLRPGLVQCYDLPGFPRTNNDMEISIRALKTRYRRISGRKNWNAYLLRYGRYVAYYEWWIAQPNGATLLESRLRRAAPHLWRCVRQQTRLCHREQLNRFRFRHHPQAFLEALEKRWETSSLYVTFAPTDLKVATCPLASPLGAVNFL